MTGGKKSVETLILQIKKNFKISRFVLYEQPIHRWFSEWVGDSTVVVKPPRGQCLRRRRRLKSEFALLFSTFASPTHTHTPFRVECERAMTLWSGFVTIPDDVCAVFYFFFLKVFGPSSWKSTWLDLCPGHVFRRWLRRKSCCVLRSLFLGDGWWNWTRRVFVR